KKEKADLGIALDGDADRIEWGSSRYNSWNTGAYGSYTKQPEKPVVTIQEDSLTYSSEKVHSYTLHCYKEEGGTYTEYKTIDTKDEIISINKLGLEGGSENRIKVTANNNAGASKPSEPVSVYLSSCGEKTVLDKPGDHQTDVDFEWWQVPDYLIAKDNFTVLDGQKVILTAKNVVHLQKGFHANKSGYFHAYLDDCSGATGTNNFKNASTYDEVHNHTEQEVDEINPKNDKEQAFHVEIYPNPADEILTIEVGERNFRYASIEINSLTGKTIYTAITKAPITDIDLSGISSGIYLIRVETETGFVNKKIIVR
ncbi:MAG: T9SS type A sorting domain-containing protein, partial [Bacteroidota bacterium]